MPLPSDDYVPLLRDEVAALREAVDALHADVSLARAELDELLTITKMLVAALTAQQ